MRKSRTASWEERHHEAQHAVGADLDEHAGQQHGAGGRRLGVRVRQPGVQRPGRQFDGEREEEPEHQHERRPRGHLRARAAAVKSKR